jgi:hypothetical protein
MNLVFELPDFDIRSPGYSRWNILCEKQGILLREGFYPVGLIQGITG